ncbi:Hsp33 family molecular chaperone HslO [Tetragenococcus muriaticus]|uniref:33 kDa chaperonin n=1 Tax=Tetragenococcus muriaticus 3MR10-3 TaxID=1302648 RepID=A0A091BWY1_9ENTE|nr:Hsp33 family molecular chaperone HslO [Tetragenococcus muriaticus]KFN89244.1 Hsp33 family heat shock protein/chaperonin [Tetragenococcus muriaticus 3MR10-3]GMA48094.1 33 kDa chaperonin [Tetragenococcus muriaticus]
MQDYLAKAMAYDGFVRAYAVNATQTVSQAQKRHDTWNTSSAALGRTLIGGLLLGSTVKGEDTISVRVQGSGPAGAVIVTSNGSGDVKGYVQNPHVSLPLNEEGKIDVKGAIGTQGIFSVTKDLGLKEPFSGQTPIVSGELGEDFTYYLAESEQIPSSVGLSVSVDVDDSIKTAGGFMLQMMPGASEEVVAALEKRIRQLPKVSVMLDDGKSPEEILDFIFADEPITILEKLSVQFRCDCSKERFAKGLISLGTQELQEMIEQDHGAEAVCTFCQEKYKFSEQELELLKQEAVDN